MYRELFRRASGHGGNLPTSVMGHSRTLTQAVLLPPTTLRGRGTRSPRYLCGLVILAAGIENISRDVRTEWAIESPNGQLLRCVLLYRRHYPGEDRQLRISAAPRWASPCPG